MTNTIILPPEKLELGIVCATERCIPALINDSKQTTGITTTCDFLRFITDLRGALGEISVAMFRGIENFRPTINSYHAPDIPPDIQVRATDSLNNRLPIRPGDNPDHRYILVVVELSAKPHVATHIIGWCYGKTGMVDEYKQNYHNGNPAWFVPQDVLLPPDTIK